MKSHFKVMRFAIRCGFALPVLVALSLPLWGQGNQVSELDATRYLAARATGRSSHCTPPRGL